MKCEVEKMSSLRGVHRLRQFREMLDYALPFTGLDAALPGIIRFVIVTAPRMARLNMLHLGHQGTTDVITYDLRSDGGDFLAGVFDAPPILAEIYLCPQVARQFAGQFGTTPSHELFLYGVHGLLHLAGEDDLTDDERASMRRAESRVLAAVEQKYAIDGFLDR